jgi:hypothetical protein
MIILFYRMRDHFDDGLGLREVLELGRVQWDKGKSI